jgi:hypothetical protein
MYENIPFNQSIKSYFIDVEIMRYESKLYDTHQYIQHKNSF